MKKSNVFVLLVAVGLAIGIAVLWATGNDVHDRRILASIAAINKFAQVLEEDGSKPAQERDLVRMEQARLEWVEALKTNVSDHYSRDELKENPAYYAAFLRHKTESFRATERLDSALRAINPEYAKQVHRSMEQQTKPREVKRQ